ncbi:hypothetical protein N5923_13605 [Erwiniaceae bacterium BAC15a-03b]|uniref:Uncharacterized protein n=1 Tax=Winslowiella arboricola TaxID=2978220 RepID=A0A9J6PS77_9GAMM|nr:hypothetical protein [Winslowiella arboricola]MCU5772139.1 hypothetical protein [Winslowiella arboricola]MCU5778525.1 hypothetical protein [Winslowiella arboricola]
MHNETEKKLLDSGFSVDEVLKITQSIKDREVVNDSSINKEINALSGFFKMVIGLFLFILIIMFFDLFISNQLSFPQVAIRLVVAAFILFAANLVLPLKLGIKAFRYMKRNKKNKI